MADLRPFRALRPAAGLASTVASPPYDVLDSAEARAMAAENPRSFLHVNKPEIDLGPGTSPYDDRVYDVGAANLRRFIDDGTLVRDPTECFYVYRQKMGDHVQTGLVAGASIDEYDRGEIRKHEKTRPNKEDDRTRHMDALDAQVGPVFLTYRQSADITAQIEGVCATAPTVDFVSDDGIGHTLWVVSSTEQITAIRAGFAQVDVLYVADGHHRSAASSRVCASRRAADPGSPTDAAHAFFLVVAFPGDEMQILDYNRVVADLDGLDHQTYLDRVGERFVVSESAERKPTERHTFSMVLGDRWYTLSAKPGTFPTGDPVRSLDVAILQENLLTPVLGIGDPRTDERIDFVGGIRGTSELARRVAGGAAVAFALFPTSMGELIAVADAGRIMPPKSTWFEPKLRSGLFVRPLSD